MCGNFASFCQLFLITSKCAWTQGTPIHYVAATRSQCNVIQLQAGAEIASGSKCTVFNIIVFHQRTLDGSQSRINHRATAKSRGLFCFTVDTCAPKLISITLCSVHRFLHDNQNKIHNNSPHLIKSWSRNHKRLSLVQPHQRCEN